MTLVPLLDLRGTPVDAAEARIRATIETEQCLLGILLYDNSAAEKVGDELRAMDFIEPFHRLLFHESIGAIARGKLVEPVLINDKFIDDEAFNELGGMRYLASLVEHAPPAANAPDYARAIHAFAVRREALRLTEEAVQGLKGSGDTDQAIEGLENGLNALAANDFLTNGGRSFAETSARALDMASEAYRRDGALAGLSTGLSDLDYRLGGLQDSDLIVLAARPSMGKTALATNIAFHNANAGIPTAFYSLEMSGEQLSLRILADRAGVPSDRIRKGDINAAEFGALRDARAEIDQAALHIDDRGGLALSRLCASAKRLKRKMGLRLVVIDYLQLITIDDARASDNRVQDVTRITGGLKALAKDLGVPVVALSQLSRQVENRDDKRPHLADLRESGSIEQDADIAMFLYREAYYHQRNEPKPDDPKFADWQDKLAAIKRDADLIIAKHRHGPIGTVRLDFDEDFTRFRDKAWERSFPALSHRFGGARD